MKNTVTVTLDATRSNLAATVRDLMTSREARQRQELLATVIARARALMLDDQEEVRLSGLEIPGGDFDWATDVLRGEGFTVSRLHGGDRRGARDVLKVTW